MTNLKDRPPAYSLLKKLQSVMGATIGPGPHVMPDNARSWFQGIVGELEVAQILDALPAGWLVLHSIPVGENSADIDHVVIGTAEGPVDSDR